MSNFQTNPDLHANFAKQEAEATQENEAKKVPMGTVFMGPLSHREETVETILRSQASGAWSEELEAQYMENVRTKATTKVRAMLLQAKKRGDEIIAQAEVAAQNVVNEANIAHANVLEQQAQIQGQFDEAYNLGMQKAMEDAQNILDQNQKALGESTAVVLLSIHQQLQKFYDVWREELRLLTLEAIKVGTAWVGDGKKEEILADMLDECVRKMVEKTNYIVRVHPSDGALVTQVLENSKEHSWTMETSKDLEPGSLELEGNHALVKNQSGDRKRFVQEILDELILPKKPEEIAIAQNVTDTLMGEMNTNPLLAQNAQTHAQEMQAQEAHAQAMPQDIVPEHAHDTSPPQAIVSTPEMPMSEQPTPDMATMPHTPELDSTTAMPNQSQDMEAHDHLQENLQSNQQNSTQSLTEAPDQLIDSSVVNDHNAENSVENSPTENIFEESVQGENPPIASQPAEPHAQDTITQEPIPVNPVQPQSPKPQRSPKPPISRAKHGKNRQQNLDMQDVKKGAEQKPQAPTSIGTPQIDPEVEAENLVDSFLTDNAKEEKIPKQNEAQATENTNTEAQTNALPTDVADDLLSEMGFGDTHQATT